MVHELKYPGQLTAVAASAAGLAVLLFAMIPSEVWVHNATEFQSRADTLLLGLSPYALMSAILLFAPGLIPVAGWQRIYAALLSALMFSAWISGVFLVPDFAEFNGIAMNLGERRSELMIHTWIFAAVFFTLLVFSWRFPRASAQASCILLAGFILISISNVLRIRASADQRVFQHDTEDFWRFSSHANLLVILMDSFQSDVLAELLDQSPDLSEALAGFTFYPDTLGVAPSTYLTMPALHSGKFYDLQTSLQEFYDRGVYEGSFLNDLATDGYQVSVINPILNVCPRLAQTCIQQEMLLLNSTAMVQAERLELLDISLLRLMPGLGKTWLFRDESGPLQNAFGSTQLNGLALRVERSFELIRELTGRMNVSDAAPTAKFLHLLNTHPPYLFDGQCTFVARGRAMNRDNMLEQTRCALADLSKFLESLKSLGIFEQTMIALVADTGVGNIHAGEDLASTYPLRHGESADALGRLMAAANPVLAIKFPGETQPFRISDVPAQLTDLPHTICESLHACGDQPGLDLASAQTDSRLRIFHYYQWRNEYWNMERIPGIEQYWIDGPLWSARSWSGPVRAQEPELVFELGFNLDDEPQRFGKGWGPVEMSDNGVSKRWSTAPSAELFLPLSEGRDHMIQFQVMSARGSKKQQMSVFINDQMVGKRTIGNRVQLVSFPIPSTLTDAAQSEIRFEFSRTEPAVPGGRDLSVCFFSVKVFSNAGT